MRGIVAAGLALLLPGVLAPERAWSAFGSASAGTSSGQFLKLGADARGTAMGDAMGPVADDATALYWNPAGLAALTQRHVTMTHAIMYRSVYYDFLAYAHPLEPLLAEKRRELRPTGLGTVGIGVLYLNAGAMNEVDNTGAATGANFTPRDLAVLAGWGGSLTDTFDLGITLKYINSKIEGSATAGALDFGARYKTELREIPFVLTANAANVGGRLRFHDQTDALPTSVHAGLSARMLGRWLASLEGVLLQDNVPYVSVGNEVEIPVNPAVFAALRGGFSSRTGLGDLDGFSGLSIGFGAGYAGLMADYAWLPYGGLGDTHRLTLSYRF